MQLIDGKATAAAIKAEIAEEVKSIVAKALAFTVSRSTISASQTSA